MILICINNQLDLRQPVTKQSAIKLVCYTLFLKTTEMLRLCWQPKVKYFKNNRLSLDPVSTLVNVITHQQMSDNNTITLICYTYLSTLSISYCNWTNWLSNCWKSHNNHLSQRWKKAQNKKSIFSWLHIGWPLYQGSRWKVYASLRSCLSMKVLDVFHAQFAAWRKFWEN